MSLAYETYGEAVQAGQAVANQKTFFLTKTRSSDEEVFWIYDLVSALADTPGDVFALGLNRELWAYDPTLAVWARVRGVADGTQAARATAPDGNAGAGAAVYTTRAAALAGGQAGGVNAAFVIMETLDLAGRTVFLLDSIGNVEASGLDGSGGELSGPSLLLQTGMTVVVDNYSTNPTPRWIEIGG